MSKQRWAAAPAMVGLVFAWAFIACLPTWAGEQEPSTAADDLLGQQVNFSIDGPAERLEMVVSTSRIVTLESKIPRLLVGNPDVVNATPISPNQVQVSALKPGVTQLNVWDEDKKLYTVDVVVIPDARQLQMLINAEFPDANVRVRPLSSSVYLSGYVPSPTAVESIVKIAEDYYPKVVNDLQIGGVQQVLLKTKVMEVSRTKLREAGFDWQFLDGQDFVFQASSSLLGSGGSGIGAATAAGGDTVRFGIVNGSQAFFGFIEALRENKLLKVLAEPQLVTVSGQVASFNSGGEFPVPIPQSLGTTTIEYREYGTRVDFVPIVLGNGNIRLEVRPRVSELDTARGTQVNGELVPGFNVRWVDTAVEMKAGQTLALAGLIQQRTEAYNRGIPGLSEIPWFGVPFRRVKEETNEVELLIVVTPEFIEASDPDELPARGPGEATTSPNDCELYFRQYLEVPKCCNGAGCPECRPDASQVPMDPSEMEIMTPDQLDPGDVPVPAGEPIEREARRPARARGKGAAETERVSGPVRATVGGELRETPSLIGPIGYESLK
ncbi:MAG: type II and III secretion system protein family protein [Planctomycetota bacterium]